MLLLTLGAAGVHVASGWADAGTFSLRPSGHATLSPMLLWLIVLMSAGVGFRASGFRSPGMLAALLISLVGMGLIVF